MSYPRENIFYNNGQFDAFVELTFVHGSDAYKKFGRVLLGTFYYTKEERVEMQKAIDAEDIKYTDGYVKFHPSDVPKELEDALKVDLDKKGILNTDIELISSLNLPRTNRYTVEGIREIQNNLVIKFDFGDTTPDQLHLGNLRMRIGSGYGLIKEEWEQYNGLELFHNPENWAKVVASGVVPNGLDEKAMRFYYLNTKNIHSKTTEAEQKEYEVLQSERIKEVGMILKAELTKSSENMEDLAVHYRDSLNRIIAVTASFDTEVILPYKFPIWWNLERFLHIYLRHVKETNIGERFLGNVKKSLFKYSFKDVRRIVSAVIRKEYEEIEKHFATASNANFRRQGKRAVYYDGVYYRFEIAPSGLIMVFHPEDDLTAEP